MARKHQVLVVDDDESVCDLVRAALELEEIEVSEAHHVFEADRAIAADLPDAIVLDIGLPGIDGLFYCERLRAHPRTRSLPIIVISGSAEASTHATTAGATAYLRKPIDPFELLTLLRQSLAIETAVRGTDEAGAEQGAELERLFAIGQRQHELLDQAHRRTLMALSAAIDSRDLGSAGHSDRVNVYGIRLALEVEPELIDDPSLEWGFLLHDVGMIGIPDRIMLKPTALDAAERAEMQNHTVIGEQLLAGVPLLDGEGLRVVRSHHERWDGTGYPDRLGGLDIPAGARIFAAVDALDAMTDGRPYRPAHSWEAALRELGAGAGSQFDPDVIHGLMACEPDLRAICEQRLHGAQKATV
jgi:response regulator RpfG family c-di-GMP phosphodiesterase